MNEEYKSKIDDFWSKKVKKVRGSKWWHSKIVINHINLGLGFDSKEFSGGITELLKKYTNNRRFEKGVSVGCGNGLKEMKLIQKGIVESFDLFELSKSRIEAGKLLAKELNLSDKVNFYYEDVFERNEVSQYDFVHWNNSLHHMPNTYNAVKWSKNILKDGGYFYMDDYVGPNRFQWTPKMLKVTNEIRNILPENFFSTKDDSLIKRKVTKPGWEEMKRRDPSEAPDSENILPSIKKIFPDAHIKKTGGVIYHLALNGLFNNFKKSDEGLLKILLLMDDILVEQNENHYAVTIAKK